MGLIKSKARWRRAMGVVGAAVGLSSGTAQAIEGGYVSPGLLASWTFGERGGFGLGGEVSVMHYPGAGFGPVAPALRMNYGAFLQAEKLFGEGRTFRTSAGVQASPQAMPVFGGELGFALQNDPTGWRGGVHGGVFGSAAVVGLAFRGTFLPTGPMQPALVLTVKFPMGYGCPPLTCVVGRPMRAGGGGYLLPDLHASGCTPLLRLRRVSMARQEALADEWSLAARGEFASVPTFVQLAAELEELDAPDALVDAALTAAEDEIRHARASLAIASAYAQTSLAPAMLPFDGSRLVGAARTEALAKLATASLVAGRLGEGAAADRAQDQVQAVADPIVAAVQETIAREERTHAELGWAIVSWCLREGGAPVRRALARAVEASDDAAGFESAFARLRHIAA